MASLPKQCLINLLFNKHYFKKFKHHYLAMNHLMNKQHYKVKISIVDTNNCLNEVFLAFDRLYKELFFGF